MMLKRTGNRWTATIDGEPLEFYGVFDAENRLEDDNTGLPVLIAGSVVTVESSVARRFDYNQELTDSDGGVWYVREVIKTDDGSLSRCNLTLKEAAPDDC